MKIEWVTQKELASAMKVSPPFISKIKAKGIITKAFREDGKINKSLAIDLYEKSKRTPQKKTSVNKMPKPTQQPKRKKIKKTFDNPQDEINYLLENEDVSLLVSEDIQKRFWARKREEVKYLEEIEKLIPIDEAKNIIKKTLFNLSLELKNIPNTMLHKNEVNIETANKIEEYINRAFRNLNNV